jgi:hypothetical protein
LLVDFSEKNSEIWNGIVEVRDSIPLGSTIENKGLDENG